MSDVTPSAPPYRSGLAAGLGAMLLAGLVLAIVDIVHTGAGALPLLAAWALVAIPLGLAAGFVLGGGNAQWGHGWVRGFFGNLRRDEQLDRAVAAALLASVVVAAVLAGGIGLLATKLVANRARYQTGALLVGVLSVVLVPVLALLAIPLYRAAHRVTRVVPAIGPLSRTLTLAVLGLGGAVLVAAWIVLTKLDYQRLPLGSFISLGLLPVLAAVIGVVAFGPARGVRERIPARGLIPLVGLGLAVVLVAIGFKTPSETTKTAVVDRSYLGSLLVPGLRAFIDRDKDGASGFFGGPDCDDGNASVHPGADEVPENGLDDNCIGGDGKKDAVAATPPSGGGSATPPTPASTIQGGKNVLVIFVDTLRADRMGYAGYQRDGQSMTPRLDAFAKDAVVFEKAYAQSPNTPRSVPSMLTSKYPSQVKWKKKEADYGFALDEGNDFLFEVLKPAGFKTLGVSSHFYFCNPCEHTTWMNTNAWQGADEWDNSGAKNIKDSNYEKNGGEIAAKAISKLEALAKADQKFAMIVHLFEPHSTYLEYPEFKYSGSGGERLSVRYDYEIKKVDEYIGQLLDALDKTGLSKTTTVVLVSDHGEAFGVHKFAGEQMYFHGQTIYEELLHVPLLFRVPGVPGRKVSDVVELVDVSPTIAALMGVEPAKTWRGRSLVPALEGKPLPSPRAAYAELMFAEKWKYEGKSMITPDGRYHVYYRMSESSWELYDLVADPEERKNIFDTDPKAKELQGQLTNWIENALAAGRN